MTSSFERTLPDLSRPSLAHRARAVLLDAILDGHFEDRLPPEDELASTLNISRTTLRAAVQDLVREGLLTRRPALGTRINRHVGAGSLGLQRLVGFERLLSERGHTVRVHVEWQRAGRPWTVDAELPWPDTDDLLVVDRRYLADDRLAVSVQDLAPWNGLTRAPEGELGPLAEVSRRLFVEPIDHTMVQIRPAVAGGASSALDLPDGTGFIQLLETHFSLANRAVAWSRIDLDDRLLQLEMFRSA